jgi:hypothetical protein
MRPAFRNRFKRPKRRLGGRDIAISRLEIADFHSILSRPDLEIIRRAEPMRPQPGSNSRLQPGSNPRRQPGSNPRRQPGSNPRRQPGSNPRGQPENKKCQLQVSNPRHQPAKPPSLPLGHGCSCLCTLFWRHEPVHIPEARRSCIRVNPRQATPARPPRPTACPDRGPGRPVRDSSRSASGPGHS